MNDETQNLMKPLRVKEGEFTDWYTWPGEPFEHDLVGPFYFRMEEGAPVCAFRVARKHLNAGGVVHGGCLMSFADFALFAIAHEQMREAAYGITVAFTSEFLDGPQEGELVKARGEVLRAGGSLIFVRGLVTAEERPCLNFSGTIKRVRTQK